MLQYAEHILLDQVKFRHLLGGMLNKFIDVSSVYTGVWEDCILWQNRKIATTILFLLNCMHVHACELNL